MNEGLDDSPVTVLLAGATGYGIIAPVRDAASVCASPASKPASPPLDGVDVRIADVTDAGNLREALNGVRADAVVSCIASRTGEPRDARRVDYDANRNLLAAASATGARHFVLLSAICVQKPRLAFQHAKLEFEQELVRSGIDYTIVRPTAFFKSLSGQVERVRNGKPYIVFGDGRQNACKPISAGDLASFIVDCLENTGYRNRVLPIGGPGEALTPREQGELLFELTGRTPRFRQVPPGLFSLAAAVLTPLGWLSPRVAAKAELARIAHYYATESMLVWDDERGRYDAAATPATGTETLRDHYARMLGV